MQTITINKIDKLNFAGKEAYKTLRTNIQFSGENVKVLAITSCTPGEGKSSVSMNLALSMAEAGKKVLFVDADMRKSVLAGRHKIKNAGKGLSHYLSGQCDYEDVICETNIENFHLVISGPVPPNPSELLDHQRMKDFLKKAEGNYDYAVIDCPPLGSVVDALLIGKISDGIVIVTAAGTVSYKFARHIKKQLEKAECKILGVILNKVDIGKSKYYKNYYADYYAEEE